MIHFGPFTFEPTTGSLWRGGTLLPLLPKDAAVLAVLMHHAGQIVLKATLLEAVWPETYVTDTVLKNSIARLRRLLGDDRQRPHYIETHSRRGYRFLGTVEPPAPEQASHEPPHAVSQPLASCAPGVSGMVGREPELALLHERLTLALDGQRQVVWITGEAGIGKTTLLDAFVAQIAAKASLCLAYGQCIEHYGEGEPYRPLLEALDRLCRGPDGQRLLALLRQEAPLWVVQLPGVLSAAELETLDQRTPPTTPARMQRELVVALERLSREMPLLLVLEDLHWSDYATLDLLALLTQRRDPARLLLVGTYRPMDVQARAHPLPLLTQRLARSPHCGELALTALAEADVAAYLTRRLSPPTWPPPVVRWLHRRSGGNPLFLVTLVDYLVQHRALPAHSNAVDLEAALAALEQTIPTSLQQMIVAQFQQLRAEEQHILAVASVAGMEFSAAAVAAGLQEPVVPVEARCEALARRGDFLEARGTATWHDGTVAACYRFRHTLYQQVVYACLPAAQRHQLHQRLGACFEHAYGEQVGEIATELARHWQQGGDAERAVCYHGLAAQRANRRSAPREACTHVAQALALLQTLPATRERTRIALRLHLTVLPALLTLHGSASREVVQTYDQVQALWRALGETTPLSPARSGLWREFYWIGPLDL
jgi:predicted ATPase/DNA-binding winged helix-turn-helix (wHTH) protein